MDTSSFHYKSRRPDQAGLEARIKAICETRVRYGYRRVHVLLQREGWRTNIKKTHRIYNALGLQLRNKTPKRRVKAKLREDRCEATRPNETWAMDFVHDQLATGRKIRVLTVVDTFSRFSPVVDPRFSTAARCGQDPGAGMQDGRLSDRDQGRPGFRVHLPRPRPVGIPEGCRARLLAAGQAHG
jgi:putative transposase